MFLVFLYSDYFNLPTGLDDRRDRRRAKALIVKDKTQSAKATGKAAANRLILATATTTSKSKSKSKKSTRPIVPGETTSETSSADFEVVIEKQEKKAKKVKKGNTMDEINKLVQGGKKAGNIAGGSTRLTVRIFSIPSLYLRSFGVA